MIYAWSFNKWKGFYRSECRLTRPEISLDVYVYKTRYLIGGQCYKIYNMMSMLQYKRSHWISMFIRQEISLDVNVCKTRDLIGCQCLQDKRSHWMSMFSRQDISLDVNVNKKRDLIGCQCLQDKISQ